ncbi:DNA methyltransferase, partial [Magnetococcales bacterium HHB-1]
VFSNPKPVRLLQTFFSFLLKEDNDIVLDFFAGSGVTAKAIFESNAKDAIARRFILIQLPESLDLKNKEHQFATSYCSEHNLKPALSEITKERLRRAGQKIKEENPLFAGDTGFRVFKLDSSNIHPWNPERDHLKDSLFSHEEHLVEGRSEQDLLFELLLKFGLDLTVHTEEKTIAGKTVYSIGLGTLMVCFAEEIKRDEIEPLANGIVAWWEELDPIVSVQLIFRDNSFADDIIKSNLAALLQQGIPSNRLAEIRSL